MFLASLVGINFAKTLIEYDHIVKSATKEKI